MQLTKLFAVTVFATVALMVTTASAQVNAVRVTQVDNSAGGAPLAGLITNDVRIDFTGQYTGSQMLVSLTAGSIYQNTEELIPGTGILAAGDLPPTAGAVGLRPAAAFDTFVAQGGAVAGDTLGGAAGVATGAGAVNLGGSATKQFNTAGINQSWNAAPGVTAATSINDMLAARVTLSGDAAGTFSYLASAAGVISAPTVLPIVNGVIGGAGPVIPEPSTIILLAMGALGLVAMKRRNG